MKLDEKIILSLIDIATHKWELQTWDCNCSNFIKLDVLIAREIVDYINAHKE